MLLEESHEATSSKNKRFCLQCILLHKVVSPSHFHENAPANA
jgi:hypothetical protein